MRVRGILAGGLALVALHAAVSTDRAAGRVGSMLTGLARLVDLAFDPTVPAIPDLSGGAAASATPAADLEPAQDTQPPRRPQVVAV